MPDLMTTYMKHFNNNLSLCIKQNQGTCGLVSLWYAAKLLTDNKAPIPFPRRTNLWLDGTLCGGNNPESLRKFAKLKCNSAQGEILSGDEMKLLVEKCKCKCDVFNNPDLRMRQRFIQNALAAQHPVLIPYSWERTKWVNRPDPTGTLAANGAAHWSLIIGRQGTRYKVLEPNNGNILQDWEQTDLLLSNGNVDVKKFPRYWMKTQSRDRDPNLTNDERLTSGPKTAVYDGGPNPLKIYDLYPGVREQELANLLVAVKM